MESTSGRQLTVTVSAIVCVLGTLVGLGVIGGQETSQAAGGVLSATSTYIAPASSAFSIWSLIYVGLLAFTLWQWLPRAGRSERHRAIGWLAGASLVLNAVWLLVVRAGWVWVSVAVIVALVLTLGVIVGRLAEHPALSWADAVVTDGTFGLYLGWVSIATCANIAAALVDSGVQPGRPWVEVITVAVLVVAAGLGAFYAVRLGGRFAVAAAMAWGLTWIGYARWATSPTSTMVAVAALLAAALVLLAAARVRLANRH